ncbi:unnamed protein product [Tilletia controversa]|nr:unnamed protein product [Tilletia controversa]CAD6979534.1 unnamed protein product [Tilletia controversa]CAD7066495.1 unnamed protein product [Tilletia caries]
MPAFLQARRSTVDPHGRTTPPQQPAPTQAASVRADTDSPRNEIAEFYSYVLRRSAQITESRINWEEWVHQ